LQKKTLKALKSLTRDQNCTPIAMPGIQRFGLAHRKPRAPASPADAARLSAAQDFLPGGWIAWPPVACDFLYSDIELFALSDFGFLASLLLRI
jgi:hypothetical protein